MTPTELTPAELLTFLAARGGQEYAVRLVTLAAPAPRKRRSSDAACDTSGPTRPLYRLTLRGETVQATGPSGQTRQLTRSAFFEVFGAYRFAEAQPTGRLSDLGPLFSSGTGSAVGDPH